MTLTERKFDRIVYHAGDFRRKAEDLRQLSNGRSTGFFGTGHYFTTSPERCARQGGGSRPIYSINVSDYNLLYGSLELHKTLRELNRYVSCYPLVKLDTDDWHSVVYHASDVQSYGRSITESLKGSFELFDGASFLEYIAQDPYVSGFINACKKIERIRPFVLELCRRSPDWEKAEALENGEVLFNRDLYDRITSVKRSLRCYSIELRRSEEALEKICEGIYEDLKGYYSDTYLSTNRVTEPLDSIPTRILKALGYDGVYPDEDTDNISYGGVIFDLDQKDVAPYRESVGV